MTNLKSTDNPHDLDKDQKKTVALMRKDFTRARKTATLLGIANPSIDSLQWIDVWSPDEDEAKEDFDKAGGIAMEVFGVAPSDETKLGVCACVLCWEDNEDQMEAAEELATSLEIARDVFGAQAGEIEALFVFNKLFAEEE